MKTNSKFTESLSRLLAAAIGLGLALPAMAQDDMQGMDMSQMPGMQMPTHKPAPKKAKHETRKSKQAVASPASAPSVSQPMSSMTGMDQGSMQGMDMSSMPGMTNNAMQTSQPVEMERLGYGQMTGLRPVSHGLGLDDMSSMQGMDMSSMQGGNAPPDARSPDYSDGYGYGSMRGMDMHGDAPHAMLLLDQLEYAHSSQGNGAFLDGEAWVGTDKNRLWLKAEGERSGGKLQELRTEALWDHPIVTYWSTQLGVRHDFGEGPGRTWAAFGVQGLAPYWFETEAFVYIGDNGRTAARVQFEYEELLTQRLILQPKLEVNLYGRNDPQRSIGSGLSDAEVGVRLRYEIRREVAPYIGIVYRQRYGRTADFGRAQGESADDLQFVAGLHVWF